MRGMRISFASVGNVVAQMTGVPIGGVLSKVATSVVLNWAEHVWHDRFLDLQNSFYSPMTLTWSQAVAHMRYVDDVI